MDQNVVVVKASRRVFRYRLGRGKGSIQTACGTRVERYLHPVSSDAKVLRAMKHIVANPANAARLGRILKSCRAPKTAGIEEAAAKATPLAAWWAPLRGQTKFVALQGADDQIAPPARLFVDQASLFVGQESAKHTHC
jgi:hypothetical protein